MAVAHFGCDSAALRYVPSGGGCVAGRLAQGEPSPAILAGLDDLNRRAGLALRRPRPAVIEPLDVLRSFWIACSLGVTALS